MTVGAHQHSMKIPHNLLESEIRKLEKIIPGVEDNQENVDVVSAKNLQWILFFKESRNQFQFWKHNIEWNEYFWIE